MDNIIVKAKDLKLFFGLKEGFKKVGTIKALDHVDIDIAKGESLGLVGETGSGKTTLAKAIIGIQKPESGSIIYNFNKKQETGRKRRYTGTMSMVFQDPYSSLNPRMTIYNIISEPLVELGQKFDIEYLVKNLESTGLSREALFRYPHEFSGGQRQRIAIARSIITNPEFIVLDEPTSGLDVSVQAQILNLLNDLRKTYGLTYLFISHNIGVVKYVCDRIAVMYFGQIVELADKNELINNPIHPYTKQLISSIPEINDDSLSEKGMEEIIQKGEESEAKQNPLTVHGFCNFYTHCDYKDKECESRLPDFVDVGNGHFVRCHRVTSKL